MATNATATTIGTWGCVAHAAAGSTPPDAPTLSIVNDGDGDAVTATVDGDAGVTNTLYYRPSSTGTPTAGETRSGDGDISQTGLTENGVYYFHCISSVGDLTSLPSNEVVLKITDDDAQGTDHSPARILAEALIDTAAVVTAPADGDSWPVYTSFMPDGEGVEDDAVTLYDVPGVKEARYLSTGGNAWQYGFQVRVRSVEYEDGWSKITQIEDFLETTHNLVVAVDGTGYIVDSVVLEGPPFTLGPEVEGTRRRQLFTLNGLVILS